MLDTSKRLSADSKFVVLYHSFFSYPLKKEEIKKWQPSTSLRLKFLKTPVVYFAEGFYFIKGKREDIQKRIEREVYSLEKNKIAKKYIQSLKLLPFIKFAGITGSLAMNNADFDSDIDLLIITKKNTLWISRLLVFLFLRIKKVPFRKFKEKKVKDKLCLNMWLDESDLVWNRQNLFSAHEIAQIIPVLNKDKTYERFIFANRWIFDFWPNSISDKDKKRVFEKGCLEPKVRFVNIVVYLLTFFLEPLAYMLQKWYMRWRITREIVLPKRAVFHPVDLDSLIIKKLKMAGVEIDG